MLTEDSGRLQLAAANHLALIRSFLIDSGLLAVPKAPICAKIFFDAATPDWIGDFGKIKSVAD